MFVFFSFSLSIKKHYKLSVFCKNVHRFLHIRKQRKQAVFIESISLISFKLLSMLFVLFHVDYEGCGSGKKKSFLQD